MTLRRSAAALALVAGMATGTAADMVHPVGAGTQAFSLANNFVALSNDMSAAYWNPAGLAFTPVKEFQLSLGGLMQSNEATIYDQTEEHAKERLRFNNAGLLVALPTTRGGIALALTLLSPWAFDDVLIFDVTQGTDRVDLYYSTYGDLRLLSASLGLQVAPGLSLGLSAGLVFGKESRLHTLQVTSDTTVVDDYEETMTRRMLGFDLRFGVMYVLMDRLRVGMRFAIPQQVGFDGSFDREFPASGQPKEHYTYSGSLLSSYTGAFGVAGILPFATVSGEMRARLPYTAVYINDNITEASDASHWKVGAGVGVEVPLFIKSLVLRAGYSWDEVDQNLFTSQSDGESRSDEMWTYAGTATMRSSHLISGGLGLVRRSLRFDVAYGYNFWSLADGGLATKQGIHRLDLSAAVRF